MAAMTDIDCVREKVPLADRTWFKLGGPAQYFAEPTPSTSCKRSSSAAATKGCTSASWAAARMCWCATKASPAWSSASPDPRFSNITIDGSNVTVGGGANLANAITVTVGAGLAGLEPLVGIPGTVGGALHGNAGTHGGDIGQWACRATVMTRSGEIIDRERNDLVFAYRQSSLDELVILDAQFELEEEDPDEVTKRMQKQWIVKKANLPMAHENTGCIFKNPRGMSAGMLIDQCGLKGETGRRRGSQPAARQLFRRPSRGDDQGRAAS